MRLGLERMRNQLSGHSGKKHSNGAISTAEQASAQQIVGGSRTGAVHTLASRAGPSSAQGVTGSQFNNLAPGLVHQHTPIVSSQHTQVPNWFQPPPQQPNPSYQSVVSQYPTGLGGQANAQYPTSYQGQPTPQYDPQYAAQYGAHYGPRFGVHHGTHYGPHFGPQFSGPATPQFAHEPVFHQQTGFQQQPVFGFPVQSAQPSHRPSHNRPFQRNSQKKHYSL